MVIPLFKSAGFMTKMSIIYVSSSKDVFIIKPITSKHKTFADRGNKENYPYQMIKFPCQVCEKPVATNHNAICCDICDCCVHIVTIFVKKTYR